MPYFRIFFVSVDGIFFIQSSVTSRGGLFVHQSHCDNPPSFHLTSHSSSSSSSSLTPDFSLPHNYEIVVYLNLPTIWHEQYNNNRKWSQQWWWYCFCSICIVKCLSGSCNKGSWRMSMASRRRRRSTRSTIAVLFTNQNTTDPNDMSPWRCFHLLNNNNSDGRGRSTDPTTTFAPRRIGPNHERGSTSCLLSAGVASRMSLGREERPQ